MLPADAVARAKEGLAAPEILREAAKAALQAKIAANQEEGGPEAQARGAHNVMVGIRP